MIKDAFFLCNGTGNWEDQEAVWNMIKNAKDGDLFTIKAVEDEEEFYIKPFKDGEYKILLAFVQYTDQIPTAEEVKEYHERGNED